MQWIINGSAFAIGAILLYHRIMELRQWHLEKGSQGPVDLGFEPTEAERRHMLFTNPVSGTRMRT